MTAIAILMMAPFIGIAALGIGLFAIIVFAVMVKLRSVTLLGMMLSFWMFIGGVLILALWSASAHDLARLCFVRGRAFLRL
jgi:hypothetical protein